MAQLDYSIRTETIGALDNRRNKKEYLSNLGYQFVNSSNVSALSVIDNDLYIRFHNGSVYRYPNSANLYETILQSNSKGKAVWKYLRRARKPYEKVGSLPFPKKYTRCG